MIGTLFVLLGNNSWISVKVHGKVIKYCKGYDSLY